MFLCEYNYIETCFNFANIVNNAEIQLPFDKVFMTISKISKKSKKNLYFIFSLHVAIKQF